jgi:hypothetical protein
MGEKRVDPVNGKYTIPGKNNRNLDLTIDDSDLKKYIVEELDGEDMTRKLPSSTPVPINWFACFAIYKNKDGKKDGYAKVKYSFTVNMENIERLFVAIGGNAQDVTDQMKKNDKVTLDEGDPPVGYYP